MVKIRSVVITFVFVLIALALVFALTANKTEAPIKNGSAEPYRAILAGEFLCLPHVDTTGPQTMECAFGLKTDEGVYYAIDFGLMSMTVPELPTGTRIRAEGVVTPVENLSTDYWQKYPIRAIFSVTNSLEILTE